MGTLDKRSRTVADIRKIDIADFFNVELPRLIDSWGHLAAEGARQFDLKPTTIITESGSWTLSRHGDTFSVSPGIVGVTVVRTHDADLENVLNDVNTVQMLDNLKRMTLDRGTNDDIHGWEAVLRSLLDRRPLFTAGAIRMLDRDGCKLDLNRSFNLEAEDEEIRHFLAEAGFVHLSGWLDEGLMREISEDMDRGFDKCTKTDGSWWATLADGRERPVRIVSFDRQSAALRKVLDSDPYRRIGRIANDGHEHSLDPEALFKPLGVRSGFSDLPWHHDCATGMHSYKCCDLIVGIQVTGAGPGASQLGVIPGSHRALLPANRFYPQTGLEPLFLTTRTGDITIHCSCVLHTSLNPTNFERRVIYTGFSFPRNLELDAVNAKLLSDRADAVEANPAG